MFYEQFLKQLRRIGGTLMFASVILAVLSFIFVGTLDLLLWERDFLITSLILSLIGLCIYPTEGE